jgi:malate dehydrogenase
MATVAIVGAGDIGGACAQALAGRDRVRRILVIDAARNAASGKALDIQQSGAIGGFHAQLDGTDDLSRAGGHAVCVIADRFAPGSPEWQAEDGLAMIKQLASVCGDAPLIFAGTAQLRLMDASARELHVAGYRLIGSAPQSLAGAIAAIVAIEAGCSPDEVSVAVLGVPPASFVVAWADASIAGYTLNNALSQVQLTRIEARVARLWPPGPYALGAAAARVAEGILESSRRSFNVLTLLDGEFGVRGRVGTVPVLLTSRGVAQRRIPSLNPRERIQVDTALGV